jgi:hypothetical protein
MVMKPVILEDFDIEIDRDDVSRLLSRRGEPENGRVARTLEEAFDRARKLVAPKAIYLITRGDELPGSEQFADLERVAFCVCTIGQALEREVTALTGRGELLRAVVLDAVGSAAAEAVADYVDRSIQDLAAVEDLKTSCRASPGYGDWDIGEQASIFRLLPAERIGVRLSESFMMIPRKSISFAIDIAKEPSRMRSENSCSSCDRVDCPYRSLE